MSKVIYEVMLALQNDVKRKIKFGIPKEKIIQSAIRSYAEELGADEVKKEVETIIQEFGDYELIQQVLRSKIVQEIDGRDLYLIDNVTRKTKKITRDNLRNLFDKKMDVSERIHTCTVEYNPFKTSQLHRSDDGTWVYNPYVPPDWQADAFYESSPIEKVEKVPKLYRKFLMHLLDDDELSFEYVLDWLANALQRRNFCFLTTIGSQGIGKGTLGEIMKNLVGETNYTETGNRILEGQFNSQIKNKRIVYCDEASVKDQKQEERIKALVNNVIEIEAKGKDVERILNYTSFYFSSNSMDSIKLEAGDRRFSIVCLTERKLPEVMNVQEIRSLVAPENIAELAKYLYYREVDEDKMLNVFISKRTEEIRNAALAGWHDWFLDDYAIDKAGQTVKIEKIAEQVVEVYGAKYRPSRSAFQRLQKVYPNKFKVCKPVVDGKQIWSIKFPENTSMPQPE